MVEKVDEMREILLKLKEDTLAEIQKAEGQADEITGNIFITLHRSFITPFDRGDIKDLIGVLDDTIDQMHAVSKEEAEKALAEAPRRRREDEQAQRVHSEGRLPRRPHDGASHRRGRAHRGRSR